MAAAHADSGSLADAKAFAERLAEGRTLIEFGDDGHGPGYRFIESTVPVYLWLLAAKGQVLDHETAELEREPV
jgi:hypothetical protein